MSLNSTSVIKIIEILAEGPIEGVIGASKGIYLDETPIEASDGTSNYENDMVSWDFRLGGASQSKLTDFATGGSSVVTEVNTEIGSNYNETYDNEGKVTSRTYGGGQIVQTITDLDIESFEIVFTVPALFSTAQEGIVKGQLFNAKVRVKIFLQSQGSAYKEMHEQVIEGIATSEYQFKSPKIALSGNGPWNIKVEKLTNGEEDFDIKYTEFEDIAQDTPLETSRGNRIFWTHLLEKKDLRTAYPYTACIGMALSTERFSSMPTRAYLIKGLKTQIPSNATPRSDGSLSFQGTFDGTLTGPLYNTCPVCAFYDILVSSRYGCGDFVDASSINLVDLYPLMQYANQVVTNPDGTEEARFSINTVISSQSEAYNVLQDLASVFRGMSYWASNSIQIIADHGNLDGTDIAPVHVYSNSSVIDGVFNYSGTALKTRSTSIRVRYNDPDNLYKQNVVLIEDYSLIDKYGYQTKDLIAFGCSSKWQAQRLGRWMMAAEEACGEIVTFSVGLEGVAVFPGQVFAIADEMRQGARLAGRVNSASTTAVTCDQTIVLPAGTDHKIKCVMPDGDVEDAVISSTSGSIINISGSFSAAPQAQSVWSISSSSVTEQKYRCLSIDESSTQGQYTITATQFNDSVYSTADTGTDIEFQDITTFDEAPHTPSNLAWSYYEVSINNNTVNRITFNWSRGVNGPSVNFEIRWRVSGGSYTNITQTNTVFDVDGIDSGKRIEFDVRSVGPAPIHKTSAWNNSSVTVPSPSASGGSGGGSGTTLLPPDPENVFIQASSKDEVTLRWKSPQDWAGNTSNLTSIIRHSALTDGTGTWPNSTLLREVQTNTDSAVLPLIEGEYMIKFKDKNGNKSTNEISAIIDLPDGLPRFDHTSRREDQDSPPFQGQKNQVFYSDEFDALVLDGTQLVDDQGLIDSWGSTDFLGTLNSSGVYYFTDVVDLGAVFTVVFKRVLKTRGLIANDTINDRATNIDRWSDFDGALADETTSNLYFRKSNDAPSNDDILTEDDDQLLTEDDDKILQESTQTYGPWVPMETGRYTGRVWQFKAELSSTTTDQTPMVDELGYVLQFENRTESNSFASGAGAKSVTYSKAFYSTPKLGITANNMATGDYYEVTSQSRTGFTVTFKNSSNAAVDRNFAYQANGYGAEGS